MQTAGLPVPFDRRPDQLCRLLDRLSDHLVLHCRRPQVNDLPTLDAELYRSLMLLRDYQGDAEDLALSFAITDADLGENLEVPPGAQSRGRKD